MLYVVTTKKALGGRNDRTHFSNSYYLLSGEPLDSTLLRGDMDAIVAAEQLITSNAVQFMSAHMKHYAHETLQIPDNRFVTKELDVQGMHLRASNTDALLPLDLCVEIKRDSVMGRAGRLFMRGCLYDSDVAGGNLGGYTIDPAGSYATGPAAQFVAALDSALPSGATFMLPEKANFLYQPARLIAEHRLGGVVVKKLHNQRKSIAQAEKSLSIRKANDLARQAKALLNGGTVAGLAGAAAVAWQSLLGEAAALAPELPAGFIGMLPEGSELALLFLV